MIVFNLRCKKCSYEFEAWFSSSKEYGSQQKNNLVLCPNCNSGKVAMFSTIKDFKSFFSFMVGFLFGTLPFYAKDKYRCNDCKTEFDIKINE